MYARGTGNVECTLCKPAFYTSGGRGETVEEQKDTRWGCHVCPAGHACNGNSTVSECKPGTFSLGHQSTCTDCDPGQYQPLPSQDHCLACKHGFFQDWKGQKQCKTCPVDEYPSSDKTKCYAHNTQEHKCYKVRECEALPEFKNQAVPDRNSMGTFFVDDDNIVTMDNWCQYQCTSAFDRFDVAKKPFCPSADGSPRPQQMCTCHEINMPTTEVADSVDKECAGPQQCSHVTCTGEGLGFVEHDCETHKKYKKFMTRVGRGDELANSQDPCDIAGPQKSIRVHHDGRKETTCKDGHFCYMHGEQCVCVQKYASRPNADRCWIDVDTPNSIRACRRLCIERGEVEACTFADANWHKVRKEAPKLELCWQSQATLVVNLDDRKSACHARSSSEQCASNKNCEWKPAENKCDAKPWHLCKSRARDEIYGDITANIRYKLKKVNTGGQRGMSSYLCGGDDSDCSFGAVKNRFTTHSGTDSYALGELVEGAYTLFVRVCNEDGLCSSESSGWFEQDIVIKRS